MVSPWPFSRFRSQTVKHRFPSGFRGLEVAREGDRTRVPDGPESGLPQIAARRVPLARRGRGAEGAGLHAVSLPDGASRRLVRLLHGLDDVDSQLAGDAFRAHASPGVSSSRSERGYAEQGWM